MRLNAARTSTDSRTTAHQPPAAVAMTEHEPVLADELVSLLAPRPGRPRSTAPSAPAATPAASPSCSGPEGRLIGIDRDPAAEARFARFAVEAPVPDALRRRRLRGRSAAPCAAKAYAQT